MEIPVIDQPASEDEQDVMAAARSQRDQCVCGEVHEDQSEAVTHAQAARMRGYLAANPGHQFAPLDDEAGIIAVIIPHGANPPEVIASGHLPELLDKIGAPSAAGMS